VYLDALFAYSYATPEELRLRAAMRQLQKDLQTVLSRPLDPLGIPQPSDLVAQLRRTMLDVQQQLSALELPSAPVAPVLEPPAESLENYDALRSSSFSEIRVPALALCAIPVASATGTTKAEAARGTALREARAITFEKNVAGARVVRVPHANHYIFLSHEADVLREIAAFSNTLK
jgi:non-heme chloroperoxidase